VAKLKIVHYSADGITHLKFFTGSDLPEILYTKVGEITLTDEEFQQWRNGSIEIEFFERKTV